MRREKNKKLLVQTRPRKSVYKDKAKQNNGSRTIRNIWDHSHISKIRNITLLKVECYLDQTEKKVGRSEFKLMILSSFHHLDTDETNIALEPPGLTHGLDEFIT